MVLRWSSLGCQCGTVSLVLGSRAYLETIYCICLFQPAWGLPGGLTQAPLCFAYLRTQAEKAWKHCKSNLPQSLRRKITVQIYNTLPKAKDGESFPGKLGHSKVTMQGGEGDSELVVNTLHIVWLNTNRWGGGSNSACWEIQKATQMPSTRCMLM